jgi:hypothetical protein
LRSLRRRFSASGGKSRSSSRERLLTAAYSRPLMCSARGEGDEHSGGGPFPPGQQAARGRGAGRAISRGAAGRERSDASRASLSGAFWPAKPLPTGDAGTLPVRPEAGPLRRAGPRRRARPAAGVYSRNRTRPVDRRDRLSMRGRLYAVATDCIGVGQVARAT